MAVLACRLAAGWPAAGHCHKGLWLLKQLLEQISLVIEAMYVESADMSNTNPIDGQGIMLSLDQESQEHLVLGAPGASAIVSARSRSR